MAKIKKPLPVGTSITEPAKEGDVVLHRNDDLHKDYPVTFSKTHAEKLLQHQAKKGLKHYSLPADSKLIFEDGNIKSGSIDITDSVAS